MAINEVDRIRTVKRSVAAQLHTIPGVHAVGVGAKVVGGKETEELAIAVFVEKKKSREELAEAEVVPSEIQGIKTDVVELPRVRLLNADPNSVKAVASPLPPDEEGTGGIVTLSGKPIPDYGIVVVVDLSIQHLDLPPKNLFSYVEANGYQTLAQLAKKLKEAVNQLRGAQGDVDSDKPTEVEITAMPDFTVAVTRAYVLADDDTKYFKDYVRGGIAIEPGGIGNGSGTLGCLATAEPTEEHPEGMVLGLTNFHVVCPSADAKTNLSADVQDDGMSVEFLCEDEVVNPETTVLFVVNDLPKPQNLLYSAFYTTGQNDKVADVVSRILAAATGLPAGISVSQTANDPPTISLEGPATLDCKTFGPPIPDPKANLRSAVSKPSATTNTIKFDGKVSNENYGIFVKINPGGLKFTFGSFTNPKKDQSLNDVAQAVCDSINRVPADLRGSVAVNATGDTVNINNAELVECRILSDIQMGQPDADFGSTCSHCCSHRIGRIIDAQVHSDVALIQLDPKLKYKMEIQGIAGGIKANPSALKKGLRVEKHGRTSGTTTGSVAYTDVSTDVEERNGLVRLVEHGFIVSGDSTDPFSIPGDSGSAILSSADNSLVGLLWGHHGVGGAGMAIEPLIKAFPKLQLSFSPAPGEDPDTVQTVPEPFAFKALEGKVAPGAAVPQAPQFGFAGGKLGQRLDEAESEIRQTALGREYADVVRRHLEEGFALVNGNRRVATVWRRSGGPEILEALTRVIQFRNERLPAEIHGKPLAECLGRIRRVLMRYASADFSADLSRYTPQVEDFSRMTYAELLTAFQSEDAA